MTIYEFKYLDEFPTEKELDRYGRDGWRPIRLTSREIEGQPRCILMRETTKP